VRNLIAAVAALAALVAAVWGTQALANTSTSTSLAARVKLLETRVAALKKRVEKVEVRQGCVRTYLGAVSKGGYQYMDPVRGWTLTTALSRPDPYAAPQYRFALVAKSCQWPEGSANFSIEPWVTP
jgi:hypothetical protein